MQFISSIVLLFALGTAPAFAAPTLDSIDQRVLPCTSCHGAEGRATRDGYYPRIAGKPAGYLFNQLRNFRDGARNNAQMSYLVQRQSDAYLMEIARYFAAQDLPYPPPEAARASADVLARGEALVRRGDEQRGVPACASCHGARLTGVMPAIPGLLGLPYDYLAAQLGAWTEHTRHAIAPDCMAVVVSKLQPEDVGAVAAWLAAQALPADAHPAPTALPELPLQCGGLNAASENAP